MNNVVLLLVSMLLGLDNGKGGGSSPVFEGSNSKVSKMVFIARLVFSLHLACRCMYALRFACAFSVILKFTN